MDALHYFAADYETSRSKFREAALSSGAELAVYTNPASAPGAFDLCTDVAVLGDRAAPATLLLNTATHGVEGFIGSAAMVGWLRGGEYRHLPYDTKVVLVHALNPFGFAWKQRTNEDNVDVNRNFVDHGAAYPENAEYERLHSMLVPTDLTDETLDHCIRALELYTQTEGLERVHAKIGQGQYLHPDGLFFGGHDRTWSNRTFCTILAESVAGSERVGFVDFHSGPGPYGHATVWCSDMSVPASLDRAILWYGPAVNTKAATQPVPRQIFGGVSNAVRDIVLGAEITSVTVEFGTFDHEQVLNALRADNWTHLLGTPDSPEGRTTRARLQEVYCPSDDDWRELTMLRSRQLIRQALWGLTAAA